MLLNKDTKTAIGLMSGTSQDGIDAALLTIKGYGIDTKIQVIEFDTYKYPKKVKQKLYEITRDEKITLEDVTKLNYAIGKCFAEAAKKICQKANTETKNVDIIGSHGQTLIHFPKKEEYCGIKLRATIQIGEPSIIAKQTGVLTVADFRPCHIALGGEGAPLTQYTDYFLFSSKRKNRAIINIGGISNITYIPKNCSSEEVIGFDSGPGNMCINEAMKILYKKDYDKDGKIAASGKVNQEMLEKILSNDFFKGRLKSTGRLHFGKGFVKKIIDEAKEVKNKDIIATFTELSSYMITKSLKKFDVEEAILCGGGYHNPVMRRKIIENNGDIDFIDIKEFGMTADNREAVAFAVLANEAVSYSPSSVGAKKGSLGKIVLP